MQYDARLDQVRVHCIFVVLDVVPQWNLLRPVVILDSRWEISVSDSAVGNFTFLTHGGKFHVSSWKRGRQLVAKSHEKLFDVYPFAAVQYAV